MHLDPIDMAPRNTLRVEDTGSPRRDGLATLAQAQRELRFVLFDRCGAHLRARDLRRPWLSAALHHPWTRPVDVFVRSAGPGYVAHEDFEEELAAYRGCRTHRCVDGRLDLEFADLSATLRGGVLTLAMMVKDASRTS